jgi:hypothetical protein
VIDTRDGKKTVYGPNGRICFSAIRMRDMHWKAAVRVLLYLKGTISHGLPLGGKGNSSSLMAYAYVDADFANESVDYKSITGYLIFYQD